MSVQEVQFHNVSGQLQPKFVSRRGKKSFLKNSFYEWADETAGIWLPAKSRMS